MNKEEETVLETDVEEETTETEDETTEEEMESEEDNSEEEASEDESEESTSQFNYDDEIAAENERGKPDPQKARDAFQERQKKRGERDDSEEEEVPLTESRLMEILSQNNQNLIRETQGDRLQQIAETVAESPKEAEYLIALHKNRSFPQSMSLVDQLAECKAIADHKRLKAQNGELRRAVNSKDGVVKKHASTQRDPQRATAPQLEPDQAASLKRAGYVFNAKSRQYEKTLPTGKVLVWDTKTRKSYLKK